MRLFCTFLLVVVCHTAQAEIRADHTSVAKADLIPNEVVEQVVDELKIFYGHTSHGSQPIDGMALMVEERPEFPSLPTLHEISGDLGVDGDLSWVPPTRAWLDANPDYNVVAWSWCGGASHNTEEGTAIYLDAMNRLERDYPRVVFVYMTGHLNGTGPDGNLYRNNNQIREYCRINDKVLFDFADIESWDPDGVYYPDETDACNWCVDYCEDHTCSICEDCAHSHGFNCYIKGRAFWWMLARIVGWDIAPTETKSFGSLKGLYR